MNFKIGKFTFDTIETNDAFNISKKRFYYYLLTWYPFTIRYAIEDMEKIQNEELKNKYQLKRIKEENEEALEFIYDVYEKFPPNEDEYLEAFEIKEIEEVLKK